MKAKIWRWFSADAIQPWRHRTKIFPPDPDFELKATRVLDLYARHFEGNLLGRRDYVISADEKTSVQARGRRHPTLSPGSVGPRRVEHEYCRGGCPCLLRGLGR